MEDCDKKPDCLEETIDESTISLESTSDKTSKIDTILIRSNNSTQISLQMNVVNNDEHPEHVLSGKIIAEKKKHSENWDGEEISIKKLKTGEYYQIVLEPSEVYTLYRKLSTLYASFSPKDGGEYGKYVKFDGSPESIRNFFHSDPFKSFKINQNREKKELIESFSNLICHDEVDKTTIELMSKINFSSKEVVNQLLNLMTMSEELKNTLANIDLKTLSDIHLIVGISRLKKIRDTIRSNLDCGNEKRWQKFFENNIWVLEQLFFLPAAYLAREAETGISDIRGKGSNTTDFAFTHKMSNEIGIIEIKTPKTALIDHPSTQYRNHVYTISSEVVNGVSQALRNRYNLLFNYKSKTNTSGPNEYTVMQPKCILIIGSYSSIQDNEDHISTFELYRNNLQGVQIITFDELVSKIDSIINLISKEGFNNIIGK